METANFQTLLPGLSSLGSAGPGVSLEEEVATDGGGWAAGDFTARRKRLYSFYV